MGVMLITGAASGLGAATARLAAAAGWDVAIGCERNDLGAEQVAEAVRTAGSRAVTCRGDVSDPDAVAGMFDAVLAAFGRLDCLVNNAGIAPGYGPFEALTPEQLTRTWAVNITGPFLCAQHAVRHMRTDTGGGGGSIINVSSKAAVLGGPNEWIHYAASKGALDTLTAGLAKEYATLGVRVNGVRPGLISGGFGPWAPADRTDRMAPAIPMGRAGSPEEIAASIVWLASDAASYVTGATLDVTGGR
jgi:NAD(P)-dependent dehydrogenase (short-subunit alcohol dehydrogenase family)